MDCGNGYGISNQILPSDEMADESPADEILSRSLKPLPLVPKDWR